MQASPGQGGDGTVDQLSNDYLNHYSEVLMLLEMASVDPAVVDEIRDWEPVSYRAYFEASPLRRAPAALAAYEALAPERRAVFEELTAAMDRLALAAIRALTPPCEPEGAALVTEATVPALRRLIETAAAFLNSGGRHRSADGEVEAAQEAIDRLLGRPPSPSVNHAEEPRSP
jgi:L-alanine-DL-glutamate epimerase-like enolase superfamily enzyme